MIQVIYVIYVNEGVVKRLILYEVQPSAVWVSDHNEVPVENTHYVTYDGLSPQSAQSEFHQERLVHASYSRNHP